MPKTTTRETTMTVAAAEAVTTEIRAVAGLVADNLTRLRGLVERARDGGADRALGYRSWTEYLADVVGTVHPVDRAQRRMISAYLAEQGLSTRAIGPIVGVHHGTVASDLRSVVGNPTTARRRIIDAADAPDIDADAPNNPPTRLRIITGRDGKTYKRPVMPPRPGSVSTATASLPVSDDDFARVLLNLKTAARELTRLTTDPRFSADRFARHGSAITAAAQAITAAAARFDVTKPPD